MELQLVGVVTKPQALKGQFRIKPEILNLKQFKKFESITIDKKEYKIESVTIRDTFVIAKVQGLDSCEEAEALRNKKVFALMEIDANENLDLEGFSVSVNNDIIGKIVDINNYGAKDILSILGTQNVMIPVIDGLIEKIDNDTKIIYLNSNIFDQVAVYED